MNLTRRQLKTGKSVSFESIMTLLVAAVLTFSAWALGGSPLWSQVVLLTATSLLFVTLWLPWPGNDSREKLHQLLKFPVFWLGLSLLLYVLIQWLNPAWDLVRDERVQWLVPRDYREFLPHGVNTPLSFWNPGRVLLIWSPAWLLSLIIWLGVDRRRSIYLLLMLLAAQHVLHAILVIAERLTHTDKIYWLVESSSRWDIAGSFIYANHGALFLNMGLALFLGFFLYYHQRRGNGMTSASPYLLLLLPALLISVAVILTASRGAQVMNLFLWLAFLIALSIEVIRNFSPQEGLMMVVILSMLGSLSFFSAGLISKKTGYLERMGMKLNHLSEEEALYSPTFRLHLYSATNEMIASNRAYGFGAGCFSYFIPAAQVQDPVLGYFSNGQSMRITHAHSDFLQFLAEYGFIGFILILAGPAYCLSRWSRRAISRNGLLLLVALISLVSLIYAVVEHLFYNPALLLHLVAFQIILLRAGAIYNSSAARNCNNVAGASRT